MRKEVFDHLHGISHPGITATRKLITSRYFWPRINGDCNNWTKTCLNCQRAKVYRHTKSPIGHFSEQQSRFEHIHMDLVGPLPSSQGYVQILTIIDRFSRWPEAYPLRNGNATTVAKKFVQEYIPRFGCPSEITTDQDSQFEAHLFKELTNLLGTHKIRTTAYHPTSNGMIERAHRQLKDSLRARCNTRSWSDELPFVLLGMRTTVKEDLKCTPGDIVYGQALRVPGELLIKENSTAHLNVNNFVDKLRIHMRNIKFQIPREPNNDKTYIPKSLNTSEFVFIRTDRIRVGLEPPYEGPFQVVRRLRKYFIIDVNGKNLSISIDRLKPAYTIN